MGNSKKPDAYRIIRGIRYVLLLILPAIPATLLLLYTIGDLDARQAIIIGTASLLITVPLYFVISLLDYIRRTPSYKPPTVDRLQIDDLIKQIELRRGFSAFDAEFYMQMIVDPHRYTSRTSDRISPTTRAFVLRRTQTIALPLRLSLEGENKEIGYPLPVDIVNKRALVNQLRVEKAGGNPASTLTQAATIAHTLLVIDTLIDSIGINTPSGRISYRPSIRQSLVEFLCRGEPVPSDDDQLRQLAANMLNLDSTKEKQLRSIVGMLHILASHYPLVVYVRPSDSLRTFELSGSRIVRMTTERRVLPHIGFGTTFVSRQVERVRGWLGVPAAEIRWALVAGLRSRSYHVEIMGPPGTYLARQRIRSTSQSDRQEGSSGGLPNSKILGRYGQRFAHLYVCDFRVNPASSTSSDGTAEYVATFFERPPGTIGVATISALASLALMTVAAAIHLGIPGHNQNPHVSTDLVAILLAVPPLTAAWIGLRESGDSTFRGTAVARPILLSTVILDVAAGALYVLTTPTVGPWYEQRNAFLPWMWLVLAMAWFSISGIVSWSLRVLTYRHFIKRQPPDTSTIIPTSQIETKT